MGGADRTLTGGNAAALPAPVWRARLRRVLGYALAAACLAWVLHDYDFRDLLRRVAAMNLALVAAAILCDVLSYVCQGVRWRLLRRPFGSISVLRTTQAVYAGLFTNEVMPMKPGELVRAYLVAGRGRRIKPRTRLAERQGGARAPRPARGVAAAFGVPLRRHTALALATRERAHRRARFRQVRPPRRRFGRPGRHAL